MNPDWFFSHNICYRNSVHLHRATYNKSYSLIHKRHKRRKKHHASLIGRLPPAVEVAVGTGLAAPAAFDPQKTQKTQKTPRFAHRSPSGRRRGRRRDRPRFARGEKAPEGSRPSREAASLDEPGVKRRVSGANPRKAVNSIAVNVPLPAFCQWTSDNSGQWKRPMLLYLTRRRSSRRRLDRRR